ncbi:LysR substrate-binding domain-containing protein [Streptomyces sp. Y7]|uniref:LysR substrate-binding domain-containing protein n=1 Tax=Streptomyces sp. Y7 TaxID=3342392 RepID=UPI0037189C9D
MELRHLRYFVTVVEEMHFRRAAERLFIAQPALSKQVKALEDELGTQLLNRNRRTVTLTEAGSAFYEEAIAVLKRVDVAKERARATGNGLTGQFSIGFIPQALFGLLQHTLRRFREHYPQVRIRVVEGFTHDGIERAARGEVDCAFVRLPIEQRADLEGETVAYEEVRIALPTTHPLTEQPDLDLADLAAADFILFERHLEPGLYDSYIAACASAGFSPRVLHTVTSLYSTLGLVGGGLGVGFVPATARTTAPTGVTFRRLRRGAPQVQVGLVWPAQGRTPVLDNFLALRPWTGATHEVVPPSPAEPSPAGPVVAVNQQTAMGAAARCSSPTIDPAGDPMPFGSPLSSFAPPAPSPTLPTRSTAPS